MDTRDERKRTYRRGIEKAVPTVKSETSCGLVMRIEITCLLTIWQSLFRGHDFYPGLLTEHRKPLVNVKGKHQVLKQDDYQ